MPRSTQASGYPQNDSATYRDLLLFEERLKTTAASLQRRKSRYQLFLFQLLLVIAFLLSEVLLPPEYSLFAILYAIILQSLFSKADTQATLHPYFASGLLFVSITTLVLFFASGMYSEKIAYANKYVPHANRALRSFNMYLNVRKPPLRSKFALNPLAFFFPRPDEPAAATSSRSTSPTPTARPRARSASISRPIAPIPPAANPRGELIFSSRVDKSFRESYERYRAVFERKRREKERAEWKKGWIGKLMFWDREPVGGSIPAIPGSQVRTPSSTSSRGKASRSATPPSGTRVDGIMMKSKDRSASPMRASTVRSNSGLQENMRTTALGRSHELGNSRTISTS